MQALGLAIVIYSWLLHLKSSDYGPLIGNQWFTAPVILIISAKVSMLLGILGCFGAWFEKKFLLFIVIQTQFRERMFNLFFSS
jgi:hypothetical protein